MRVGQNQSNFNVKNDPFGKNAFTSTDAVKSPPENQESNLKDLLARYENKSENHSKYLAG